MKIESVESTPPIQAVGVVVTSGIAVAEISSAFHRKLREDAIDQHAFRALQGQFRHDLSSGLWRLIAPTEALIDEVRALFSQMIRIYLPHAVP